MSIIINALAVPVMEFIGVGVTEMLSMVSMYDCVKEYVHFKT
jgi:hypothetical protein